ncbi:hypothetical protein C8R47DRAFT_1083809 [Mycena vitilis]|nr:hypothetical protein C8R47DRAFT_1083809 [Mycena vitilis]
MAERDPAWIARGIRGEERKGKSISAALVIHDPRVASRTERRARHARGRRHKAGGRFSQRMAGRSEGERFNTRGARGASVPLPKIHSVARAGCPIPGLRPGSSTWSCCELQRCVYWKGLEGGGLIWRQGYGSAQVGVTRDMLNQFVNSSTAQTDRDTPENFGSLQILSRMPRMFTAEFEGEFNRGNIWETPNFTKVWNTWKFRLKTRRLSIREPKYTPVKQQSACGDENFGFHLLEPKLEPTVTKSQFIKALGDP